jgi:hypothetical protein
MRAILDKVDSSFRRVRQLRLLIASLHYGLQTNAYRRQRSRKQIMRTILDKIDSSFRRVRQLELRERRWLRQVDVN